MRRVIENSAYFAGPRPCLGETGDELENRRSTSTLRHLRCDHANSPSFRLLGQQPRHPGNTYGTGPLAAWAFREGGTGDQPDVVTAIKSTCFTWMPRLRRDGALNNLTTPATGSLKKLNISRTLRKCLTLLKFFSTRTCPRRRRTSTGPNVGSSKHHPDLRA